MTTETPKLSRTDVALKNAERAKQATLAKLKAALEAIESEMMASGGVYAINPRGLNRAEVARRAGMTDVTLAKPRHKATRKWLDLEIERLIKGKPKGKRQVRRSQADRIKELEADNNALRTQMIIHELERSKAESQASTLAKETAKLRDDLAAFRRQTIVEIGPKSAR